MQSIGNGASRILYNKSHSFWPGGAPGNYASVRSSSVPAFNTVSRSQNPSWMYQSPATYKPLASVTFQHQHLEIELKKKRLRNADPIILFEGSLVYLPRPFSRCAFRSLNNSCCHPSCFGYSTFWLHNCLWSLGHYINIKMS